METIAIIMAAADIIICIVLVILVIWQEGNDKGMGVIGGGADTFFSRETGKTKQNMLKKFTAILAIAFAILTVILYLILARGF